MYVAIATVAPQELPSFKNPGAPFAMHVLSNDVELRETHRILRMLDLDSFNYSDIKTLMSLTSRRHQQFS